MKLIERHLFGGILNSLKQFLKPKYSIDEVPTGPTPPAPGWSKLPILEPDKPVDTKTYNGGTLPGVTVSAINLSKPLPFPYGGINVVSKSINGGLDKKQRVFVNPFDKSYLASNYKEGGLIRKHQFGGSNKSNRFISSGINNIPEINVNGIDRRWRLSKRGQNHGNGHGVTSEYFYDYYDGGNHYLGDNAVIKGGRTIYTSPKGNDTLYWNNPSEWLWYQHGLMPVGGNLSGAKQNFFKNLKRPLVKEQQGGSIPSDNTRVLKPTQLPLKVKPINWSGAIQGSHSTMEPNSHGGETFYSVQRKQSKLGDKFTKEIRTYYRPGLNYVSDTTYSINPVYGESRLAFRGRYDDSAYPSLNLYDSLKTAFNRIVAKETNQHPYFLK